MYGVSHEEIAKLVSAIDYSDVLNITASEVEVRDACSIALIRETVGEQPGIKASGGVAAIEDGVAFIRAGANIVAMRRFLVEQLENLRWSEQSG